MKLCFTFALIAGSLFLGSVLPSLSLAVPRPVRFATNGDYPPISFREHAIAKGVCIDIIKALGDVTGRDMPVQLLTLDKAQQMVRLGEADALGLLAVSEARRVEYDFSDTVLVFEYSLFVRSDEEGIRGLKDLAGKTVGVTLSGFPHQALQSEPGITLVPVESYQDGLRRLLAGNIQAFACDKWVALYYLQQDDIKNIKVLDPPFATRNAAFAVKKGNHLLLGEINRGLALLQERGTLQKIFQKWSGKKIVVMTREKITLGVLIAAGLTALALVTLLCLWVYTLKRQIAERRYAEEELRTSEERYRTLVEKAPDAIILYDIDLEQILDANANAERLFGCPRQDLVGSGVQRFFHKDQPDGLRVPESMALYQDRAIQGKEVAIERSIRNLAGDHLVCEVRLVALPARGRRLIRASFIDATGRKAADRKQRESEEKFRGVFENAPFGIYQTSGDRRLLSVNPTLVAMFGFDSPLEMLLATPDVTNLFAYVEQRESLVSEALVSVGFAQREVVYRRRDGSHFDAKLYMRAVPGAKGSVGYFEGFVEDITLRKRALCELGKFSQAIEQSPASIVITDTAGVMEFVNPKFSQLTGYPLHEALGKHTRLLNSGLTPASLFQELWNTVSSGRVWEGELRNRKKSGELFWEHVIISPIRDAEGNITNYIAVKDDITDQKSLKEQLFQSQKMEAVGQLAGGIAHDFNNILTVIIGYASMLRRAPGLERPFENMVHQIITSADKAAQLTRALLTFSRKQIMNPKPADLNTLVRQVQSFLARIIGEDVQLKLVIKATALPVLVDSGQIEQVLMNLATNARDAMPKGGVLVIETELLEVESDPEHPASLPGSGRYAVVSVSDSGVGMDESTLSRIFEPFFTTKEVGKGTGLGMAIVHGVITQHNGTIMVRSEPGQGTTFKIYLPLSDGGGKAEAETGNPEPVRGGSETILVAEDDAAVGALVRQVLSGYGYRVLLAADGEQAVASFRKHQDAVSLVLMDMIMPRKSGWEAAREIAEIKPVRVLFTSGYTRDFIKNRGELEEGCELILKPVQPLELLRKVRAMLDA
jgi:two-component system, cell cycle sensor histidine kinase and response regulator CckA